MDIGAKVQYGKRVGQIRLLHYDESGLPNSAVVDWTNGKPTEIALHALCVADGGIKEWLGRRFRPYKIRR